ncbi:hypothetical protein [Luteipulveratus mongoliensis]|uniref:Membrane protein n=1 Tax=Luteipulveratus mongoliensis TaxID=571913 RepID=A0A0K1JKU7_9MICO|nr:hypothetical protein [Luteipulveratus mongoliensis]AKU17336.1 membrane protein [Luteipulveratus mongoliensis]
MSVVAALLLAIGLGDLARSRRPHGVRIPIAIALATLVAVALLADLTSWADLGLLVVAAATAIAWITLSSKALRQRRGELWPLAALGAGLLALLVLAGAGSTADGALGRWMRWVDLAQLHEVEPQRFLLILGLVALQLSTGNELVRLVLTAVGAIKPQGQPQPSDRLKGGRLLGPMERVFILGLGLAGEVTAAGLVIAAKGLIRFPELSSRRTAAQERSEVDIDEVTEYFLVGSFVSWLLAMAALGLAVLS